MGRREGPPMGAVCDVGGRSPRSSGQGARRMPTLLWERRDGPAFPSLAGVASGCCRPRHGWGGVEHARVALAGGGEAAAKSVTSHGH